MPKPIVFIAALLLALPAFAQTRMPARQVEADTNMVNIAISLPFTVQAALDWIDANWPALSSESWSNLDPAEDEAPSLDQAVAVVSAADLHDPPLLLRPGGGMCSARARSSRVVILMFRESPGTMTTGYPARSTREASSVP